jgi:succinate-acetate transporter protein
MKYANPAPLGLAGFALTTWMLSMVNAGWYDPGAVPLVLASAFAFGGTAQFVAGVLEFPRGNTFGLVAFCAYGAFWWSFALFAEFFAGKVPPGFVGWWLVMWGVFTFYMWLGTFRANRAVQLIFLALCITFVVLGVGDWTGSGALHKLGGYLGLVTAVLAFYLSAAEIINETRGKTVLPIGPYRDVLSDAPSAQTGRAAAE